VNNTDKLKQPPFVCGSWAALAFVEGKYNPPGAKGAEAAADDFLGMYVSRNDPGIGLITFTGAGEYVAFHRCGDADSTVEFAAIDAFIHYRISFEQWRIYPIGEPETAALEKLGLRNTYEKAMKGLAAVLYQARTSIRPRPQKLDPMFLISPRSIDAVLEDKLTREAIWRALFGEERAARHIRNVELLRKRLAQPGPDEKCTDEPE